jgi:hypothetical protein
MTVEWHRQMLHAAVRRSTLEIDEHSQKVPPYHEGSQRFRRRPILGRRLECSAVRQ